MFTSFGCLFLFQLDLCFGSICVSVGCLARLDFCFGSVFAPVENGHMGQWAFDGLVSLFGNVSNLARWLVGLDLYFDSMCVLVECLFRFKCCVCSRCVPVGCLCRLMFG